MVENHPEILQLEQDEAIESQVVFDNGFWYELTGSQYKLKKFLTKPNLRGITVRDSRERGYIFVKNSDEQGWLGKEVADYNLRYKKLDNRDQPVVLLAACGVKVTVLLTHERACNSCKSVKGLAPRSPRNAKNTLSNNKNSCEEKTVFSLPGLPDMSMNGVLSLARQRVDETLALSVKYQDLVTAIEGMQAMEEEFKTITESREQHIAAIEHFMKEK